MGKSSNANPYPQQILEQEIRLSLRFPVYFTEHLFDAKNPILAQVIKEGHSHGPGEVLFVVDDGLVPHCPQLLSQIKSYVAAHAQSIRQVGQILTLAGGEGVKNDPVQLNKIYDAIYEVGLCRHSYVVVIGGGAVLDVAGYAAATAHRGVRLIRVPTTVLSQNDSGVGVKTGINAYGRKNFLGTFTTPFAVLNDSTFLTTLDERDWRGGIAEAVKVALIKDANFFEAIGRNASRLISRDLEAMKELVFRCAKMHVEHIGRGGDPFESGSSRPLDFGHWAAHKLEHVSNYRIRHGEAVAIGIAIDTTYSYLAHMISEADWRRIMTLLSELGFDLHANELEAHLDEPAHPDNLLKGLSEFREHLGGRLTIMLLRAIGKGVEVHEIDENRMRQSILMLREWSSTSNASQKASA